MAQQRKALGRGLAALIPELPPHSAPQEKKSSSHAGRAQPGPASSSQDSFLDVSLEEIAPSPENPRHFYDDAKLQELSQSIQAQGLIQPLVVRPRVESDAVPPQVAYVLIAGERRFRAAQRAHIQRVPVVVKDVTPRASFELALVENVQREDLNPIEEAEAYRRLSDEFGYTQEQLAQRVGRARESIANALRLLKLPTTVQGMVAHGEISMGHARALLAVPSETSLEQLAKQIAQKQLSVRQTEELVRRAKIQPTPSVRWTLPKSAAVRSVEESLEKALEARVRLVDRAGGQGKIEIAYHSAEQLDALLRRLMGPSFT